MSHTFIASPDPIAAMRQLVLRHQPSSHARMTDPGYRAKYLRVAQPITDADLAAHLAGDLTLGVVLHQEGYGTIAACDIDSGGEAMVRQVMRAAEARACHAYGFVLDSGAHNGGHVWIFFEHPHASADLAIVMRDILTDAQCPTTEIYPNNADLRLPFGLHRQCNRRGALLLNSAASPLDLDADLPGALAAFLATVRCTNDIPVRMAQELQATRRTAVANAIAAARPRAIDRDAHWREVIAHFNTSTDLVSLLERYGARAAYHYPGGKTLLHCASASDHAHGDAHPSLVVEPGRGHQTGKMICGCYAPSCRLHNQPGQVMDAFEVFCRLEGISKREGVQRIHHQESPGSASRSSHEQIPVCERAAQLPSSPPSPPAMRVQPAPVPLQERLVQQRLVEVQSDRRVQPLDRRLLAYVISHGAEGYGIANAALAAALGARPDSIKRAKRRLRELGYIDVQISTDGQSASIITIRAPEGVACPEGGVQEAPPSHVSESTCVDATPPPESTENDSPQVLGGDCSIDEQPVHPDVSSETKLRRRRGVLLGMLRAGVEERRRRAFVAELAHVEASLAHGTDTSPLLLPVQELQAHQESLEQLVMHSDTRLAQPEDPHPPLSDARLTAVLRDIVHDSLPGSLVPLLARVSWHQQEREIVVVCTPRDLASVTEYLLAPSQRALRDSGIADVVDRVKVQIGEPEPVEARPAWIDAERWTQVPVWLRSSLIGSVYVDGRVYGATPAYTARLVPHSDIVHWLLDAMGTEH